MCLELRETTEKQTAIPAPVKTTRRKNNQPALRLASWKVRTMCPSHSDELQQVDDARKTAVINRELKRLDIDIAALQKTKLPSNGSLREQDYTFFWQGKDNRTCASQTYSSAKLQARAFREGIRNDIQRIARNNYWLILCQSIQLSADCGNIRAMYKGMKKAFDPSTIKIVPLRSTTGDVITDRGKQMERWAEHYQQLYSRENVVTDTVLESTTPLAAMKELDALPTVDELSKAIDSLACGKAPGSDGIPPEVIKTGQKSVLLDRLHELLLQCWEEGTVPQDMRDANIITLYKNKGDRSDCNNYRGISLLSIVGKAFAHVVLNRLQVLAERVYPEAQCGFRSQRSTIDMIFLLRQLQEKCREQRQPLYITFINLTKAFNLVSRKGLFTLLHRIGCPPSF